MTTLDLVILVVAGGSLIVGFMRGIIVQLGSLGGIVAAWLLCRIGAPVLAARFAAEGQAPDYLDTVLANVILFIVGYLGVRIICHFFKRVTHALKLGFFDRLGGAAFSLFEWMLVLSLGLNLWLVLRPAYNYSEHSTLGDGKVAPAVVELAPAVLGYAFSDDEQESDAAGDSNRSETPGDKAPAVSR